MNINITPYENRIVIPKIWENIPLLDIENKEVGWMDELNNIFMKELANGVIRYPSSWIPWKIWNPFIFWHSSNFPWIKWEYNDVFALLDKVDLNDEIIVYYGQKKFKYKIKEKRVVKPSNVKILKNSEDKSEITIMTCWPIWTTLNRLILVWDLIKEK
jgi:sortase (surface protein transpeptidase)